MIKEENGKYFTICDDCKNVKEVQRQTFLRNSKKEKHLCLSCSQVGDKNNMYGKKSWNNSKTKETDIRIKRYGEKISISKLGAIPWNLGLTKETDIRVEKYGKKVSITKKGVPNPKNRKLSFRSKSFQYFRKVMQQSLYSSWVFPILERDSFKCTKCFSRKNLEVHHLKAFRKIFLETSKQLELDLNEYENWSKVEMSNFRDALLKNHKLEDGVTLCKRCHIEVDKYRKNFETPKKH